MSKIWIRETAEKTSKEVKLFGWIDSIRDHGKVVFADLRDRSGIVQLVGGEELKKLGLEDVVEVKGKAVERKPGFINPRLETGKIEIKVEKIKLLAKAKALPFDIQTNGKELSEEVRIKYRYLDLRRKRLRRNLQIRHQIGALFRQLLGERGFWEVETPSLGRSTPEGARDFLVPSRLQPGCFYALPQSPQQYKQLLMVAGVERYFQLATCFRDEDLRADRQFEFTQVDIEMSFMTRDEVLELIEEVVTRVFEALGKKIVQKPFPRISYQEAMEKYGSDSPDLRKKKRETGFAFAWVIDFPLFEKTATREISPMHHPFTAPNPKDTSLLDKNPLRARSLQYDLVCNGMEVGGGSIRITDPVIQEKIFGILGHSKKELKDKFGHLLEAFSYGVPPHGGIALGLDRLVALSCEESSIREVIAFPMTARGRTAVMEAPASVAASQLKELGIKVIPFKRKK